MLQEVLRVGHLGIWTESVVASQANEWLLTWVLWVIWECSGGGDMESIQTEVRAQWNAQRNKRLWPWGSKRALRISFSSVLHSLGKSYTNSEDNIQFLQWKNGKRTLEVRRESELVLEHCPLGFPNRAHHYHLPRTKANPMMERTHTHRKSYKWIIFNYHQILNWEPARSALRALFLWQKYPSPGISTPLYLHSLRCLGVLFHSQHTSIVITQGTGILGGSAHSESRTNPKPQSYPQPRPISISEARGAGEPFQSSARTMG